VVAEPVLTSITLFVSIARILPSLIWIFYNKRTLDAAGKVVIVGFIFAAGQECSLWYKTVFMVLRMG